jgi:hypothetical protein
MRIQVCPSFTLNIQAETSLNSNVSTFIILQQAGARYSRKRGASKIGMVEKWIFAVIITNRIPYLACRNKKKMIGIALTLLATAC